jgi:uncharacterized linocin/CFP29 family protein
LKIVQANQIPVLEIFVDFSLSDQQVSKEAEWKCGVGLATAAANFLARAEDLLIFQGKNGLQDSLFQNHIVTLKDEDRLKLDPNSIEGLLPAEKKITVEPIDVNNTDPSLNSYGDHTFQAAATGYGFLQEKHYGRQALILPTNVYADTYAAENTTLSIPAVTADRLKGLLGERVYGTGTVPPVRSNANPGEGVLVAIDGDTIDLVVAMAPTVEVLPKESGDTVFRVKELFAFRLKDKEAVVELDFKAQNGGK